MNFALDMVGTNRHKPQKTHHHHADRSITNMIADEIRLKFTQPLRKIGTWRYSTTVSKLYENIVHIITLSLGTTKFRIWANLADPNSMKARCLTVSKTHSFDTAAVMKTVCISKKKKKTSPRAYQAV